MNTTDYDAVKIDVLALRDAINGNYKPSSRDELLSLFTAVEQHIAESFVWDGQQNEIQMPSVWHAAGALMTSWYRERQVAGTFGPHESLLKEFGQRMAYRGQAKPWSVMPSSWRQDNAVIRELGAHPFVAYHRFLEANLKGASDIGLEFFTSLKSDIGVKAIAQHYGFPTDFVDFTFDPLAAIHFALGPSKETNMSFTAPEDHAVIFYTSFRTLKGLGQLSGGKDIFHFPPIQVSRLYRQTGFFMDYGGITDTNKSGVSSSSVEEQCFRIYFPRTYPNITDGHELRNEDYETIDPFFCDSIAGLKDYCWDVDTFDPDEAYEAALLGTRIRPPWFLENDLGRFFLTDTYIADLCEPVVDYLDKSALITMESGYHYDPATIDSIIASSPEPLKAILEYGGWPGESGKRLGLAAERIMESISVLKELRSKLKINI